MNKHVAASACATIWAVVAAALITFMHSNGYPLVVGFMCAFLLFFFLNGSLAYVAHAQKLRAEGKEPPRYLKYLFFPAGVPRLRSEAPKSMHVLTGAVAGIAGGILLYCGIALGIMASSKPLDPTVKVLIFFIPSSIGGVLLYFAWRAVRSGGSA